MFLLSPYRAPLTEAQWHSRALWLSVGCDGTEAIAAEQWRACPMGYALLHDRLLYHYSSYLLACRLLTPAQLWQLACAYTSYTACLAALKAHARQSLAAVALKRVTLHDVQAWRAALWHNVAHALAQTHHLANDLPFATQPVATWQLRLVHAQPCTAAWGTPSERQAWLSEMLAAMRQWPSRFTEEEHPSNGDLARLGRADASQAYRYLQVADLVPLLQHALAHHTTLSEGAFVTLYNSCVRLSGAYAARPLANAALLPREALWDTLQQHRVFALRAPLWLSPSAYLPPCTQRLLTRGYAQAERPPFLWGQYERKRYLEHMQQSLDTLLHTP